MAVVQRLSRRGSDQNTVTPGRSISAYPLPLRSGAGRQARCSRQLWPLLRLAESNSKALGHAGSPRAILHAVYV